MYVLPRANFKILDPAMQGTPDAFLPPEGREVQPSDYWSILLRDGDVGVIDPDVVAEVVAATSSPAA